MSKPEWVGILEKQIEENPKYTTYALASLSPDGLPRSRHVIHRGVTPSNLLLTTTDTRMQKPHQLESHHDVEMAWWMEPPAVQFRIRGKAYTIPPDEEGKIKALKALGVEGEESKPQWWEDRRMKSWKEEMSGHLRASFARPPPGKPLSEVPPPEEWPERLDAESDDPEEQEKIKEAQSNFALIAIKPDFAEFLELKPTPNRRYQWTRKPEGKWHKVQVAP